MIMEMGNTLVEIKQVLSQDLSAPLAVVETTEGAEYVVADSPKTAGKVLRRYWEELFAGPLAEFIDVMLPMDEEVFRGWIMGQGSFPEWLDSTVSDPRRNWALDNRERNITDTDKELTDELGFIPKTAYLYKEA